MQEQNLRNPMISHSPPLGEETTSWDSKTATDFSDFMEREFLCALLCLCLCCKHYKELTRGDTFVWRLVSQVCPAENTCQWAITLWSQHTLSLETRCFHMKLWGFFQHNQTWRLCSTDYIINYSMHKPQIQYRLHRFTTILFIYMHVSQ